MPRPGQPGEASRVGSVAVPTVGTGPDQAEALTLFIVEEVGEDRSGEARIVKLEAQVVAALVGALGPAGTDLNSATVDSVAGAVLARAAGFGDDPDVFGLEREGDDFAVELVVAGLLEGADGRHGSSP